jgi:hypothetical protein
VIVLTRLLLLPLITGGCGMTALVETRRGQRVEARIVGGSPGSIYLAGEQHDKFTIRRDDIADVDFPGNGLMLGGAALIAFGGYRLMVGDTSCGGLSQFGNCFASVAPGVAGLLVFAWGLYSYWHSTRAFEERSRPEPDPPVTPRAPVAPPPAAHPVWQKPDPFADPHP